LIQVRKLELGPIATNCYVASDAQGRAFVVDPGYEYERVLEAVRGLEVTHILLTHAHFDHIGGVQAVKEATGAQVLVHEAEAGWLTDPSLNLSSVRFEFAPWEVRGPEPDALLRGGETLELLGHQVRVLHAPGHSPGHVCYLLGDLLFGGDVLFAGSIGRTDLPGGDFETLLASIRREILSLNPATRVLPGHGPETTIGREARSNPFLAYR